jgi:hypothetical protein
VPEGGTSVSKGAVTVHAAVNSVHRVTKLIQISSPIITAKVP